ncbi:AtzE family amidohydrolase [Rhodovulum sp. 12E13]|uniref:AtzE family amidohydrolase n=1 Tax=Rhodovulum sp. 12E13 TaxID=2203891 RepID=UPI000E1A90D9|nr:AtzE family amidohydrolase [Rhodovulum sp. 12E13]RDC75396.1 AtzE family amidohydrolase [Rhodovulum sp. 12E13]
MSVVATAAAVRSGRDTAADTVARALAALEAAGGLNAATHVHAERARARAATLDARIAKGDEPGPLAGVPFAVKNLFDVAGQVTRAGSRATEADAPAAQDAFAIRVLEAAGAVLVASTNMDELAYGFSGENAHDGDTRNPHDARLSAGGSSSGSAALVAAGAVPLALGTDTNGSVRVPAALSGVVGLKPTYGRLSRAGVHSFVHSLDHVGLFAATAEDIGAAFAALDAPDPDDPVQARGPAPRPAKQDLRAARLGGWFAAPLHPDVAEAVEAAGAALGASRSAELTLAEAARAAAFVITTAEGGQRHLAGLARHPERFGPLVRDRLRAGALVPAAWTGRAQKLRRRVTDELAALHRDADILIAPATPCPAFPLGAAEHEVAGETLPIRLGIGMFTQPLTLTGVPIGVAVRRGARSGLPVGVQVIGRPFEEEAVLAAMTRLEREGFVMPPAAQETAHA